MEETEKTNTSRKRYLKYGFIFVLVIAIGLIGTELFIGGNCAQVPCTAATPCVVNGTTYTTGSVCGIGQGSGCGYISNCKTRVDTSTNKPHCDCVLF